MENGRFIKSIIIFLVVEILTLFPFFLFAYSDKTTHPALTNEVVTFFNIHYPESKLDNKARELVVQGSINEDAFGRWMRHYYDPVYNRGLVLLKKWQSSKEWAQDSRAQSGFVNRAFAGSLRPYFSGEDDYSWERSVYEYAWGDRERGLLGLGHILHFIEDATVPPHTRNDPHLVYLDEIFHDRSPYEHWASKFDIDNIDVLSNLQNEKPIELNTLDEYFDRVAGFTNENFFSKDTIFHEDYENPIVKFEKNIELKNEELHIFGYSNIDGKLYK